MLFSQKVRELVSTIHTSGIRCCIAATGAGSTLISALTSVPGCSKMLLDAQVPYSTASTVEILDYQPRQFLSSTTAIDLSHSAYYHAKKLTAGEENNNNNNNNNTSSASSSSSSSPSFRLVGLGATSAIATDRERKGEDRLYASCRTQDGVTSRTLLLTKGLPRHVQEWMVACVLLQLLAEVAVPSSSSSASSSSSNSSSSPVDVSSNDFLKELCFSMLPSPSTQQQEEEGHEKILEKVSHDLENISPSSKIPVGLPSDPFELLLDNKIPQLLFNRYGVPHFDGNKNSSNLLLPFFQEDQVAAAANKTSSSSVIKLLYPGSFSPLHYGHTECARAASRVIAAARSSSSSSSSSSSQAPPNVVVTFEVATSRVDKSTLKTPQDLIKVAEQFWSLNLRLVFSTAKLFIDKARAFPDHGFIVGIDTAIRCVNTKYFGDSKEQMIEAYKEMEKLGSYFLVAGRKVSSPASPASSAASPSSSGTTTAASSFEQNKKQHQQQEEEDKWLSLDDVEIPQEIRHLFISIPEVEFRVDVSSTELRARAAAAAAKLQKEQEEAVKK